MSVNRHTGGRIMGNLEGPFRMLCARYALTANLAITDKFPVLLFIDPNGAGRNVLLPAPDEGLTYCIVNTADAAETITLRDYIDTLSYGTIGQNARAWVVSDGVSWYLI